MKKEKVHTVPGYWDGPIEGVANYLEVPHRFNSVFDEEEDEYLVEYELQKISEEEFELIIKSWIMWLNWNNKTNKTTLEFDSHPVLPDDRNEYESIEQKITKLSQENDSIKFKIKGAFLRIGSEHHDFEVIWEPNDKSKSVY